MAQTDIVSEWEIGWFCVRVAFCLLALAGLGFFIWLASRPLWCVVYFEQLAFGGALLVCFDLLVFQTIELLEGRHA